MAIALDSTLAPAIQPRGLLRSRGAPCRVLSHGEILALLGEKPELPPEPLLRADLPRGVASSVLATVAETSGALARHPGAFLPDVGAADRARDLHARRELRDALEYGFALLDALGLPPLALDVIDDGIAALDRMDAADEDLEDDDPGEDCDDAEPSLGAPEMHSVVISCVGGRWHGVEPDQRHWADGGTHDRETEITDEPHDDAGDAEPSIGWPEDYTAKLDDVLQADHDPEFDDADSEDDLADAPDIDDPIWSTAMLPLEARAPA